MTAAKTLAVLLTLSVILLTQLASGVRISFFERDREGRESDGNVVVRVLKDDTNVGTLTVRVMPLTIDSYLTMFGAFPAELAGLVPDDPAEFEPTLMDFDNTVLEQMIPPSTVLEQLDFDISLTNDDINEAEEGFVLVLEVVTSDSADEAALDITRNVSLVLIDDDDVIEIVFSSASYTVNEADGNITLMIMKLNNVMTEQTIDVTVISNAGSSGAERGVDYTVTSNTYPVTLLPEDQEVEIGGITIIDDDIVEQEERFTFNLALQTGSPGALGNPQIAAVFITDNEFTTIGFEMESYEVTEADGATVDVCIAVLDPVDPAVFASGFFSLTPTDGSATASDDYTGGPTNLPLTSPSTRRNCITISISNDDTAEEIQSFTVVLGFVFANNFIILNPDVTTVTIFDDDGGSTITITPDLIEVIEGMDAVFDCAPLITSSSIILDINGVETDPSTDPRLSAVDILGDRRTYTYSGVLRSENGSTFQCFSGSRSASSTIANLIVYYAPEYTVDPLFTVIEGMSLVVSLDLIGNPFPESTNFQWTFDGVAISSSADRVLGLQSLELVIADRSETGTYEVTTSNVAGSGSGSFQVTVFFPPEYTVDPTFTVIEGNSFNVGLDLIGDPFPDINNFQWTFNGMMISSSGDIVLALQSLDLGIADRSEAGIYEVTTSNVAGSGSGSFQIIVYYLPLYTILQNRYEVVVGGSITIDLTLEALPFPGAGEYSWTFNGQPLSSSGRITLNIDRIQFSDVMFGDAGIYTVTATNTAGSDSATFELVVTDGAGMGMGGDPHFNILLTSGQQLCFSVQGEKGFTFNLISNEHLTVNALFTQDKIRDEITWISALGVIVRNSPYRKSNVTKLRFDSSEKKVFIGDEVSLFAQKIDQLTFSDGKLTISESLRKKAIEKPKVQVEIDDIGLSFSVKFVRDRHLDLSWEKVDKQLKDSHGMIGQFFRDGIEIDETRKLLILPHTGTTVPVMRKLAWHFVESEEADPSKQLCWVAMNPGYQGKRLIEGSYLDYLVDDVFTPTFEFHPEGATGEETSKELL